MSLRDSCGNTDITLRLPPRPDILKNKPNPFYEKDGAIVMEGYTLPKAKLDKLFDRLGRSEPSKQLQLHEIYVQEVLNRGSPAPRNDRFDESIAERLYTSALSAHQKTMEKLSKTFLGPIHPPVTVSRDAIDDFVERNYERQRKNVSKRYQSSETKS
jgi:hypothetical protein